MHSGMSLMSLTPFGDRDKGPVADLVFLDAPIDEKVREGPHTMPAGLRSPGGSG